jgi:SagB-type dehydrogenase family enzyme
MDTYKTGREFLKADWWEEWRESETDQRKGMGPPPPQEPFPEDGILVDLVPPGELTVGGMGLIDAIRRRRSRRKFTQDLLTLEELSFLLWGTQGLDEKASQAFHDWGVEKGFASGDKPVSLLRTVPSGGARHPFETYILVNRVEGLGPGLYRYLALQHKLLSLQAAAELTERIDDALSRWVQNSAVVFMWTAVPNRMEWRYGIVSHKMIAQESGHVCQNLYLACEAIGAGTCAIGAYDQAGVDGLLGVDGKDEFAVYVAPVGKVSEERYHFEG